jgi:hypothetical protein
MALGMNKILIAGTIANTPGAYDQLVTISATTAGNIIPAGTYVIFPTTNVTISAVSAYNSTTNVATWTGVYAANTGGFIVSDGVNFAVNATTNTTVTALTVNGGLAASGTYNT